MGTHCHPEGREDAGKGEKREKLEDTGEKRDEKKWRREKTEQRSEKREEVR